MERLWVTGYRAYELNVFGDKDPKIQVIKYALKQRLVSLLEEGALDWVITGANLGTEQWAAEVALELREEYPLKVSVIIPYENFADRWNDSNQSKFLNLKNQVDFFASTSKTPYSSPAQLRNYQNFMLKHTDSTLMVYDTEYPGKPKYDYSLIRKYQESENYELDLLDFYDLQSFAEEYFEKNRKDYF